MTELYSSGGPTPVGSTGNTDSDAGLKDKANEVKDRAGEATQTAKQAGSEVAQTATEKAKEVADEAQRQARNLVAETRDHLSSTVSTQHSALVDQLRSIADELNAMVNGQPTQGGVASELVGQAGDRAQQLVGWLQNREPADLLTDVRQFARQRPGAFLAGAAIAGVLAGRLTRGAVAAHKEDAAGGPYTKSAQNYPDYTGVRHPSPAPVPATTSEYASGFQPTQPLETQPLATPGGHAAGYSAPAPTTGVEQFPAGGGYSAPGGTY